METWHEHDFKYFFFRINVPCFLKINIKRSQIISGTAQGIIWQLCFLGGVFLAVTKQEPKNNKNRHKGFTPCVSVNSGIMTQCLCVTANAKGPGPLSFKGINQWSFGKTDGKPLAEHRGRPGAERRAGRRGRHQQRPFAALICVTVSKERVDAALISPKTSGPGVTEAWWDKTLVCLISEDKSPVKDTGNRAQV